MISFVLQNDFFYFFFETHLSFPPLASSERRGCKRGIGQTSQFKFRVGLIHVSTVCLFKKRI